MEALPDKHNNSTCLELTMAMPGTVSSSPISLPSSEVNIKIEAPTEECMEEEDDDHESPNQGPGPRKKLRLTKEQSRLLEESFLQNQTLYLKHKEALAMELKLKPRQVEVWFQNRRARSKTKQTEIECKYLKKWFGTLSEQNKRLQMEVEELRSIKAKATADCREPSTLTMCPGCQRLASTVLMDRGPATTNSAAEGTTFDLYNN